MSITTQNDHDVTIVTNPDNDDGIGHHEIHKSTSQKRPPVVIVSSRESSATNTINTSTTSIDDDFEDWEADESGAHTQANAQRLHKERLQQQNPTNKNPPVTKAGKLKAKHGDQKVTSLLASLSTLMTQLGVQNIFFGKGGPLRENPGNKFYRSIVDKYYLEFKKSNNMKHRAKIKQLILQEIISSGRRLYKIEQVKRTIEMSRQGDSLVGYRVRGADRDEVIAIIGKTLRDSPKRIDKYWYWIKNTSSKFRQWFGNENAIKLEEMYNKDTKDRETVEVKLADGEYLVDLIKMTMCQRDTPMERFDVRRDGPDQDRYSQSTITVTDAEMRKSDTAAGKRSSASDASGSMIEGYLVSSSSQGSHDRSSSASYKDHVGDVSARLSTSDENNETTFTIREATPDDVCEDVSHDLLEYPPTDTTNIAKRDPTKLVGRSGLDTLAWTITNILEATTSKTPGKITRQCEVKD